MRILLLRSSELKVIGSIGRGRHVWDWDWNWEIDVMDAVVVGFLNAKC